MTKKEVKFEGFVHSMTGPSQEQHPRSIHASLLIETHGSFDTTLVNPGNLVGRLLKVKIEYDEESKKDAEVENTEYAEESKKDAEVENTEYADRFFDRMIDMIDQTKNKLINPVEMFNWVCLRVLLLKIPSNDRIKYLEEMAKELSR